MFKEFAIDVLRVLLTMGYAYYKDWKKNKETIDKLNYTISYYKNESQIRKAIIDKQKHSLSVEDLDNETRIRRNG